MSIIVFPGQGSQYVNMAMDFNENFSEASNVFQEVEDITKINIRKIITENQENKLNQTKYTQISIFAASMAIYFTLKKKTDFIDFLPKIALGHSLGEYAALVASNVLNLVDAINLIKIRAELMNSAIAPNISGMAAIIGKDAEFIDQVIRKNNLEITIANDNSPMQVVISGLLSDIDSSERVFKDNGVKRYVKLNVSSAFHSKYMEDAQKKLIYEIDKVTFNKANNPIISNYDANINNETEKIISSLKNQMANKVKWTDSIKQLEKTGLNKIIEIGPGKVLSGLILRISNKFDIISIDKIKDLEKIK